MVLCPLPRRQLRASWAHLAQSPPGWVNPQQAPLLPPAPLLPAHLLMSKAGPCDDSKETKFTLPVSTFSPGVDRDEGGAGLGRGGLPTPTAHSTGSQRPGCGPLPWPACFPGPWASPLAQDQLSEPGSWEVSLQGCCVQMAGEGLGRSFWQNLCLWKWG